MGDWNNFVSVSVTLTVVILYYNYLQNIAIIHRDWSNFKCNPLYMVSDSLSSSADKSIKHFQDCVKGANNSENYGA